MTTLRVLLHVAAQRDYELHSLDFSTAFLQGSLHEEIWLRRPPGFTGSFPPGTCTCLFSFIYDLACELAFCLTLVLRLYGDFVIHPELALLCLTGLVFLLWVLGTPPTAALTPPLLCPPPDQSQPPLKPASPLPAPSPYTEQFGGLTERREPASCPVLPVRTASRVPRSHPPPVPGTHAMTLCPSSILLRVPLPAPLESSLFEVTDPESDRARAASPTVSRLLASAVTDPSFESAAASALVAELLDIAAACRLDYATALVAESASASPLSVRSECALGTDVLDDRQTLNWVVLTTEYPTAG
ncbi:unnamed protein product [Closterium sp. NIES-54]